MKNTLKERYAEKIETIIEELPIAANYVFTNLAIKAIRGK